VEIVLGVLAAASIAGVLQWVDATYTVRWAAWRWCELAALVVVAAGALAIIWRSRRSA
jgi:hypothetical protein